jgi:hypothetical protein
MNINNYLNKIKEKYPQGKDSFIKISKNIIIIIIIKFP